MHFPEKQKPIDFCKGALSKMMIDIIENGGLHPQQPPPQEQVMLGESSGEEHEMKAPKRRAETWVHEEITSLINFRREIDVLFNTTKSNRHLWQQISSKMRDKGFDRSPSMCTDKWRNLLKEFKKVKHQGRESGWAKMLYYKEIEELLEERSKNAPYKSRKKPPKVDSYIQFSDKVRGRSSLNCKRNSDHEGRLLAITTNEAVPAIGVPLWNWRETSGNGGENHSYNGRVITVKWGDFTRRIGIDGTANAIKEAIKSGFGLRTSRAFWLEDEDEIIRSVDRDMPLGIYNLRLDEGLTIKICIFDESGHIPIQTEVKTLYTENDFCEFLAHRGWTGLRDLSGLRSIDTLNDLHSGGMYQGIRMLSN